MISAGMEAAGPGRASTGAMAAALVCGVVGLNIIGVTPVLLGALADARRLGAAELGLAAMLELFAMGVATGLAGALLQPRRLKTIAAGAAFLLALVNLACMGASGGFILVLRGLAGVPEGALIWITVGMIARSAAPARLAAVFFLCQCLAQLALAVLFWILVLPRWGADGGFFVMAATSLMAVPAAWLLPSVYGGAGHEHDPSGPPPLRGWMTLLATFVFVSANGAVTVYLEPLAHEAGLSADTARLALVASLAAQVAGGALATVLAGRVGFLRVFAACTLTYLVVWAVYALTRSGPAFVFASMAAGLISLLVGPFLTPLAIAVDPSRRTAMQSAGAQIFGGAAGPLAAAGLVDDQHVRRVLVMASVALVLGFAMICGLCLGPRSRRLSA